MPHAFSNELVSDSVHTVIQRKKWGVKYIINVFRRAFNSLNVRQGPQIKSVFYLCSEWSLNVINSAIYIDRECKERASSCCSRPVKTRFTCGDKFLQQTFYLHPQPREELALCSAVRPVYLIAVLVVLEACVVVHEAIQFLEALVLLLCLQNHSETPSHRSWNLRWLECHPGLVHWRCFLASLSSLRGSVPLQSFPWTAPPPAGWLRSVCSGSSRLSMSCAFSIPPGRSSRNHICTRGRRRKGKHIHQWCKRNNSENIKNKRVQLKKDFI